MPHNVDHTSAEGVLGGALPREVGSVAVEVVASEANAFKPAALERAMAAGRDKDARAFLQLLYESGFPDGLTRQVAAKWDRLDRSDIHDIVAQAIDALYGGLATGKRILNPGAFLWKTADHKAYDLDECHRSEAPVPETLTDGRRSPLEELLGKETQQPEIDWDDLKVRGIALARSLLPRLGQKNVQDVMAYVIDAVEAGREDVPNHEIAEALGLSGDTVRTSLSRGWRRLRRICKAEGLGDAILNDLPVGGEDSE